MPDMPKMPKLPSMPSMPKVPDAGAIMRRAAAGLDRVPTPEEIRERQNAEPVADPLADVEYTGDLEEDSALEFQAVDQAYRDRAAREDARYKAAIDSEFWVAVAFQTRADKDAFLDHFELRDLGDKYLDGAKVAKRIIGWAKRLKR